MESKLGFSLFLVILISWEVHATVNCTATGAGRFADPDDTTCQNYTLCVYVSSSSSYLYYNYVCPTTSVFNPSTSQCTASSNYVCNVTTTTTTNSTTSVCTADGYFSDPSSTNCSSYIECVDISGTYDETTYTCPNNTYYNPNTTLCESDYTCPSTFTCTAAGRFANSTDSTCKTYYFCVLATNGTYVEYSYTCPSTSVFSPLTSQCTDSSNYVCNVTTTTNSTTAVCTVDGFIADPSSTNCSTYIECVNINGTYEETTYTCPDNTYYNPNTTLCDSDYTCDSTFNCTAAGRFADSADSTCQTYYFCVLSSNGTYLEYSYSCPSTSLFDPSSKVCTTSYTCS